MLLTTSLKAELIPEEGRGRFQGRAELARRDHLASQGKDNIMANPEHGFCGGQSRVSLFQSFSNQPRPSFDDGCPQLI